MFKGMKWLKCDLQMQTPGDRYNWLQTCEAYISGGYTEPQLIESVDKYLSRCHETGLHVIGITDHNFIGKDYLEKLIARNSEIARQHGKEPLVIFPGFEVEIAQGLGVHILCLFNPNTPLDVIDEMVTELGLPNRDRVIEGSITPLNKNFDQLVTFIQEHKDYPGVVIAAHPLAESGMLHDNFMTDHFQKTMFRDKRLLAMEIPKPVENLPNGIKKIVLSSDDCHEPWKRDKPIATLMSSDCYSLKENEKGYIGKRHSWIQFSYPSIDSLKQAFYDHSSRIAHQDTSPNENYNFGRIKSLEINNAAFLDNQIIHFSPNMNCIIGGRGSGKSSILEYIRLCTNTVSDFREQLLRIKNTLSENSRLTLTWEDANGLVDVFEFSNDKINIPTRTEVINEDVILDKLGMNIYSQREITQMAQDSPSLMPLINQIAGKELYEEIKVEKELSEQLNFLNHIELKFTRLKEEKEELEQEHIDLKRQFETFSTVKEFADKKKTVSLTKEFITTIKAYKKEVTQELSELQNKQHEIINKYSDINTEGMVMPEYINYIKEQFISSLQFVDTSIEFLKDNLVTEIDKTIDNHESWNPLQDEFKKIETTFEDACHERGITQEEFELLNDTTQKIEAKERDIQKKEKEIEQVIATQLQKAELLDKLDVVWKKQTEIKQQKVNELINIDTIPKVRVDGDLVPFLKIDILYMKDYNHFFELWNTFPCNRRTKLGRAWETIGDFLFNDFHKNPTSNSPWDILSKWLNDEIDVPTDIEKFTEDVKEHFSNHMEEWQALKTRRIHDAIDICLYRPDGTRAGSLLDKGLSDGQKNTAILTLLFTQGNGPIIIDQPEDELDSDFIYNELVPIMRKMKNMRQIILVSHNANLPVNGDAELIYALKTDSGQGKLRTEGGLDNPKVKQAILDIMEGSEEAFKKRSEKYNS